MRPSRASTFATVACALLLLLGWVMLPAPAAQAADLAVEQCNSEDGAGLGFACDVTVTNTFDLGTGAKSSTVTVSACRGEPFTTLTCAPTTTVNATDLVTSVSQCNFQGNGGGGSLDAK